MSRNICNFFLLSFIVGDMMNNMEKFKTFLIKYRNRRFWQIKSAAISDRAVFGVAEEESSHKKKSEL